jgi:hypothetical protein
LNLGGNAMKKIFIVLIILSLCSLASAQGFKLGVAGDLAKPTGDWPKFESSSGWGVHAFGVLDIMVLTITARAGYMDFGEYTYDSGLGYDITSNVKAIPILGGLRWEFGLPVGPSLYAGVEAGIHYFTTVYSVGELGASIPDKTDTKFSVSPNVGVSVAGFDVMAYYMYIKDMSYYGVRLGWGIGI